MPILRLSDVLPGVSAALLFIASAVGFGALLDGYVPLAHPLALLGASGIPHAPAFNLLAWILPGLLAVAMAVRLLARLPAVGARWPRVAGQLLLLAGLAFAGMGLLPLRLDALDGPASQAHASAWMAWVLAFSAGALMLGVWRLRQPGARASGAVACACAGIAAVAAFGLRGWIPAPLAQGLVFLVWAIWLSAVLPAITVSVADGGRRR